MLGVVERTDELDFDFRRTNLEFVITELRLGHTFASIALETKNESTRQRNQSNARRAYDSAISRVTDIVPDREQADKIQSWLNRLKTELNQLGEIDLD